MWLVAEPKKPAGEKAPTPPEPTRPDPGISEKRGAHDRVERR